MNYFTQLSIELANNRDYLDQLFRVYPLSQENIRHIDNDLWYTIEKSYKNRQNVELFKSLLALELFPIKDGYVPYFRRDKSAIERNPQTVNRICGRIYELGIDELWKRCTQPKETNRQMGPLFKRWLDNGELGLLPIPEDEFLKSCENSVLKGSDAQLKDFAKKYLGYERDKGIDLIARFNNKYIIGEAKFISDEGGHQNDQFLDALTTIRTYVSENVICIAIIDGVLYIPSKKKMYTEITSNNLPIMSALVLNEFLYSI